MPTLSAASTNRRPSGNAREARDRRVVIVLIGLFVVGAVTLLWMNVADSARKDRARASMGQTFVRVHARQSEFRSLYGRFATWSELRQRGATLGPRQTVSRSNADASHWFISIRDQETGITCDRTGELMDEDSAERAPVCRESD